LIYSCPNWQSSVLLPVGKLSSKIAPWKPGWDRSMIDVTQLCIDRLRWIFGKLMRYGGTRASSGNAMSITNFSNWFIINLLFCQRWWTLSLSWQTAIMANNSLAPLFYFWKKVAGAEAYFCPACNADDVSCCRERNSTISTSSDASLFTSARSLKYSTANSKPKTSYDRCAMLAAVWVVVLCFGRTIKTNYFLSGSAFLLSLV